MSQKANVKAEILSILAKEHINKKDIAILRQKIILFKSGKDVDCHVM